MALSSSMMAALKLLEPNILNLPIFSFFEFFKYDLDDLRNEKLILKKDLIERYKKSVRQKTNVYSNTLKNDFHAFTKILDTLSLVSDSKDILEDIEWEKITEICNILRKIETSNEKKIRWALLFLLSKGNPIQIDDLKQLVRNFKISNVERLLEKIIKTEINSGLDVKFDGKQLVLDTEEKLTEHYIADAIEEKSRRSPGEIEKEILELLDEGSYSNQEISNIIDIDEAVVSRVMTKLRNQNKLVLSSFGNKGFRYYTTNCQNCPFGKTLSSCRKDAISDIVNTIKDAHGVELTSQDFENIESNQALLNIKRTVTMSKKFTMTKLESNMYENFEKLLKTIVKNSINLKHEKNQKITEILVSPNVSKLPKVFQIGLKIGIEYEIQLMKTLADTTKKEQSASDILSKMIKVSDKILQSLNN
ncbi:MAG: hypothetical protein OEL56_06305 [Nitrosopumilus sp.]|nr:hypothetical protein [Nitrosopumilus sp.]MDH3516117.1 hypothetical protein [Nitrosopumilus sp.]MDH3564604.1 hypothetical protein [Nitrosopumilus sp.]MDH5555601.1 hypothetical protein [Nitrosopumilus sp.]